MKILKGIFKIIALPVALCLAGISALANVFMKIVCYALGPFMTILGLCALYGFVTQTWYNVGIAIGLLGVCGLVVFVGAFLMAEMDVLKDYLLHL